MYDICHPTYYNMSQLGCNDQVKLTTTFYVYMELCEVKQYWDVEYKYCQALQIFYLEAKKSKNAEVDTFLPWPAFHNLTLDFISNVQHKLNKDKFTFVFKDGDTTSVYYSICSGIVKPTTPEETKIFRQKAEKKFELNKEISRNSANIYERALFLNNGHYEKDDKYANDIIGKEDSDMEEFYTPVGMENTKTPEESSDAQKIESDQSQNSQNVNNGSSHCTVKPIQDERTSLHSEENQLKELIDLQESMSTNAE